MRRWITLSLFFIRQILSTGNIFQYCNIEDGKCHTKKPRNLQSKLCWRIFSHEKVPIRSNDLLVWIKGKEVFVKTVKMKRFQRFLLQLLNFLLTWKTLLSSWSLRIALSLFLHHWLKTRRKKKWIRQKSGKIFAFLVTKSWFRYEYMASKKSFQLTVFHPDTTNKKTLTRTGTVISGNVIHN